MTENNVLPPEKCSNMIDVRKGVDATDLELVTLLARRFGYMDAAARIKEQREHVRDEERKAQVLSNVQAHATSMGVPTDVVALVWEQLIEGSIAYEMTKWEDIRS